MLVKCKSDGPIISHDNRLWPCCWILTKYLYSKKSISEDENWNSLDHYSVDEILNNEIFKVHFNTLHWSDPDKINLTCLKECGLNKSTVKDLEK